MTTNLRAPLLAALAALPASWKVIGYPYSPSAITTPTIALWATDLVPAQAAVSGRYKVSYILQLFTGHQDPTKADDALDASLGELLTVLWDSQQFVFETAQRTTSVDDTIHSWTITVSGGILIEKAVI